MSKPSNSKSAILFIAAAVVLIVSVAVKNTDQRRPRPKPAVAQQSALTIKLADWSERNDGRRMAVLDITNPRDEDASIWPPKVAVSGEDGWTTNAMETGAFHGVARVNAGETIQVQYPAPVGAVEWKVFFASSHKKEGIGGLVDRAKDKADDLKGAPNLRFLGDANMTASPILKTPPPPETIAIFDLGRTQDDQGWPRAKLLVTNRTDVEAVVKPRAIKWIDRDGWHTNYTVPAKIGVVFGPLSSLEAGKGFIADLPFPKQIKTNDTWKLEMAVFPKRTGVGGVVDRAKEEIGELKPGMELNAFMGESYYIESPPLRR